MIGYKTFIRGNDTKVTRQMLAVHIMLLTEMVYMILSDDWDAREFCTKWLEKLEHIAFLVSENEYVSSYKTKWVSDYCRELITGTCNLFNCNDLSEKF